MHFRISSSLSFQRKTKRHVFLLLFVLTPMHLNWPSYATWKCYRSPRQLISTMKHWWLYITIHFLTIFRWKKRNLILNLIYLSFFVQYRKAMCMFTCCLYPPLSSLRDQYKNNWKKAFWKYCESNTSPLPAPRNCSKGITPTKACRSKESKWYLICIMSIQINKKKFKSLSYKATKKSLENLISANGNNSRESM